MLRQMFRRIKETLFPARTLPAVREGEQVSLIKQVTQTVRARFTLSGAAQFQGSKSRACEIRMGRDHQWRTRRSLSQVAF